MSEPLDRLAPAEPSDPPALPQGGTAAASAGPSSARRVGWVAILVILIVASAVAWKVMGAGSTSSNERAQGAPAASIPVAVMKVARGEVARYEVFEGEFLPFQQVELHPEIAGFLTAISVDEGDRVKDKQVLATLDVPGLDEDIARSRAQAEHDAHVIATAEATFEGWRRTGDIGYLDENNYLYIVDRAKDMIITGGYNVYSIEVENALRAHDDVQDCAVIGLPDPKWGERVVAVVQPRPGRQLHEEELKAFVKARAGSVKTPKQIEIWPDLPRSRIGKVLKAEVKATLAGRSG